jgi:lactoylglutathione lyase
VIEHVAIWTGELEGLRAFYERYFGGVAGERYENPSTGFLSYFLELGGARLELMQMPAVAERSEDEIVDGPRRTGDGYYESVVLDPDGNRIELTV